MVTTHIDYENNVVKITEFRTRSFNIEVTQRIIQFPRRNIFDVFCANGTDFKTSIRKGSFNGETIVWKDKGLYHYAPNPPASADDITIEMTSTYERDPIDDK